MSAFEHRIFHSDSTSDCRLDGAIDVEQLLHVSPQSRAIPRRAGELNQRFLLGLAALSEFLEECVERTSSLDRLIYFRKLVSDQRRGNLRQHHLLNGC